MPASGGSEVTRHHQRESLSPSISKNNVLGKGKPCLPRARDPKFSHSGRI